MTGSATEVQWLVSGQPNPSVLQGKEYSYPYYDFIWRLGTMGILDPDELENAARGFVERMREDWTDGPRLYRREVTTTDWEEV